MDIAKTEQIESSYRQQCRDRVLKVLDSGSEAGETQGALSRAMGKADIRDHLPAVLAELVAAKTVRKRSVKGRRGPVGTRYRLAAKP